MHATLTQVQDPAKAREYFENKLAFTTGPIELDRLIKARDNIVVVDVRAAKDFARGHIPGAINLPEENWDSLELLSKDKTNIVYCYNQTCHLAAEAAVAQGCPVRQPRVDRNRAGDGAVERDGLWPCRVSGSCGDATRGALVRLRHE
jgi:rhodanese-related sulfurtransferase